MIPRAATDDGSLRRTTLAAHAPRIDRALAELRSSLDDPPDVTVLARGAGLSARQFARIFTRLVGETPPACVRRLRLERAARRLRSSRATILAIAVEAGFESHEAFTRAFQRRFGFTPQAWRKLPRAPLQPRPRTELWQQVLAGGLRRHAERFALE